MKRRLMTFFLAAMLMLGQLLSGCGKTYESYITSGFFFNTIITITILEPVSEDIADECLAIAEKYENYFSTTITDSDIYKINHADGVPVTVHDETIELLELGIAYGELSGGRFDITVGRLSDLWDISTKALLEKTDASMIPSDADIASALLSVDYHNIRIEGNEVTLLDSNTKIDLGGIAKGYIADKMKAFLNEEGITNGYINLGGNVLALGGKEDGSPYTIGIQTPFASDNSAIASVEVADLTVVSSGIYERNFTVDGTLYHHILDTKTGYPYNNGLASVTIITKHSVDGDALSTTCFSLGLEDGMALVERLEGTEAIFITTGNEIHVSSGIGTVIPYHEL